MVYVYIIVLISILSLNNCAVFTTICVTSVALQRMPPSVEYYSIGGANAEVQLHFLHPDMIISELADDHSKEFCHIIYVP